MNHQDALKAVLADRLARHGEYIEIPTSLFVDRIDVRMSALPPFALWQLEQIPGSRELRPQLLRAAEQPYSPLALKAHDSVWIEDNDLPRLRRYAEDLLLGPLTTQDDTTRASRDKSTLTADEEARKQKLTTLKQSAISVVEDLFSNPSPQNINRSTRVVGSFVYVLMRDPKAYFMLSQLSSHDPYTLQHSVGTAVNSIILARKIGIRDEQELLEAGLGGLLHDIGKVKVKKEIINKNGPLDELEWEEMREHAAAGYEIARNNPDIPERSKKAILEHHEDKNGTGYPHGRKMSDVDVFSRIVGLSDIFNALTTDRSYSKARTPFDAFQLMRDKLHHKIDDELFRQMVLVYGGKLPE